MMAEYIDREAAINAVFEAFADGRSAYIALEAIPAADVAHVVRCRDCRHWDTDWIPSHARENEHFCPCIALTTREDWFCADGEKREEN